MANTAVNILQAQGNVKQNFIDFFSMQTTEVDRIIAKKLNEDDIIFGATLTTFIRLSLNHLQDTTANIKPQLANIYGTNNTNNLFNNSEQTNSPNFSSHIEHQTMPISDSLITPNQ